MLKPFECLNFAGEIGKGQCSVREIRKKKGFDQQHVLSHRRPCCIPFPLRRPACSPGIDTPARWPPSLMGCGGASLLLLRLRCSSCRCSPRSGCRAWHEGSRTRDLGPSWASRTGGPEGGRGNKSGIKDYKFTNSTNFNQMISILYKLWNKKTCWFVKT